MMGDIVMDRWTRAADSFLSISLFAVVPDCVCIVEWRAKLTTNYRLLSGDKRVRYSLSKPSTMNDTKNIMEMVKSTL